MIGSIKTDNADDELILIINDLQAIAQILSSEFFETFTVMNFNNLPAFGDVIDFDETSFLAKVTLLSKLRQYINKIRVLKSLFPYDILSFII